MAIYFAKDCLVLLLYLSFFRWQRSNRGERFRPAFIVPLLCFFFLGLIQVFNPSSTSLFYGWMGMKLYFLYVPLLYIGYHFIDSEHRLRSVFVFNSVLVLVIVGLRYRPGNNWPYLSESSSHAGGHPRLKFTLQNLRQSLVWLPIGLLPYFVSTGRFQNFLVVSWILTLGFGGFLLLRSQRGRHFAFTCHRPRRCRLHNVCVSRRSNVECRNRARHDCRFSLGCPLAQP